MFLLSYSTYFGFGGFGLGGFPGPIGPGCGPGLSPIILTSLLRLNLFINNTNYLISLYHTPYIMGLCINFILTFRAYNPHRFLPICCFCLSI